MGITDLSFGAVNLNHGTLADRPTSFKSGSIYLAEDTEQTFRAFADDVWTEDTSDFMEQEFLSIGMAM